MKFKEQWTLEAALQILENSTVDSKLWAEAVEWLMLYGPPEIQNLLLAASSSATAASFPNLTPSHYNEDGEACYNIAELASELQLTEEEVVAIIEEKERAHATEDFFSPGNATVH